MSLIRYSCPDFVLAFKMHNIPTVPLKGQDTQTLLSLVAQQYPQVLEVCGKNPWEGSTLHRLDTATEGLVMFALNQHFYDYASELQRCDLMTKTYMAVSPVTDEVHTREISTYFRAYGKGHRTVKPETDIRKSDNGRLYTTRILSCELQEDRTVFICEITRGFRHQIRAHLAYIGHPIEGDDLYSEDKEKDLALTCQALRFPLENGQTFSYKAE